MSGEDVKILNESVGKLEVKFDKLGTKLDTVVEAIADLRVLVAGNYVTKTDFTDYQKVEEARVVAIHKKIDGHREEVNQKIDGHKEDVNQKFEDHQKEESTNRWKRVGAVVTVSTFVFGIIQWVVGLVKKI